MPHYFSMCCPGCLRTVRVRDRYRGREICCNYCDHSYTALPADTLGETTPSTLPQSSLDNSDAGSDPRRPLGSSPEGRVRRFRESLEGRAPEREAAPPQLREAQDRIVQLDDDGHELRERLGRAREQEDVIAALRMELEETRAGLDEAGARAETFRRRADETERLEREIQAARASRDKLLDEIQSVHAQLAAQAADAARSQGRLVEQLEAARAERERLDAEKHEEARMRQQLRAELDERERALAEAAARHEEAQRRLARDFGEARGQWEAQRRTIESRGEQERLVLERDACALRLARDTELDRGVALQEERDRLAAQCEAMALSLQAETQRSEAGIARLNEALEWSSRQEDEVARRNLELMAQLREQRAELDRLRREFELTRRDQLAQIEEARRSLSEAESRGEAERRQWQGRLDELRERFERELESRRVAVEHLRREAESTGRERDAARQRAQDLLQALNSALQQVEFLRGERDERVAACDALESAFQREERRHRDEFDSLTRELEEVRTHEGKVVQELVELTGQVRELQTELDRERRSHGSPRRRDVPALPCERSGALLGPGVQRAANSRAGLDPEELVQQLAEVRDRHRLAIARANRWEAEAHAARDELELRWHMDLSGISPGRPPMRGNEHPRSAPLLAERNLVDARRHIEELTRELLHAHTENRRLRSLLPVG